VLFSSFNTWDVKQFFKKQITSSYPVEKLGKHLIHQTKKVQLSDYPDDEFGILGVSNKIGMFDADTVLGKKVKQKYHIVKDDWLAYNPYRVNVGSIGIKTAEQKGGYISPAYVVFSCKDTLLPEYLWLIMKSGYFNDIIRDSTTGTVRQTLGFDKLANLKVPIPTVPEQKKILQSYHDTLEEAEASRQSGDDYSANLLYDIQSEVSNLKKDKPKDKTSAGILKVASFSSTDRWEVAYILKEGVLETVYDSFKCQSYCISQLTKESLFGLSIKASLTKKAGMIPMLRMPNIVNGEIDCSELKYLPYKSAITVKEPRKWLLEKGDFLINRTNSKELVGKAAVFNLERDYTYASYVIRYRFDTSIVLPEYVNIMFMLPLVRKQIDAVSRQTAGQCNINSDEIGAIRIPVPSIPEQQTIIDTYNATKNGSQQFYRKAEDLKNQAELSFEHAVFS
jgi:type I restriction enzyme S subunit